MVALLSTKPDDDTKVADRTPDLVRVVLAEAVGSTITPFVPVPFVDDYLFARLLRRIARKVLERGGRMDDRLEKAVVDGYVEAGATGLGEKALMAATRFVIRKVAIVLDVKRSHDVFGESIVFALALDSAVAAGAVNIDTAHALGAAIYRSTKSVGAAAVEHLTRAAREAFAGAQPSSAEVEARGAAPDSSRFARVATAIRRQVEETRRQLDHLMEYEISRLPAHLR